MSFLGAHFSAQGGVHRAVLEASLARANTLQLFTANQKRWVTPPIAEEEVERWNAAIVEKGMKKVMSHGSYLINLGSPKSEVLAKSKEALAREIKRCRQLGLSFLNIHPGAALDRSEEECLNQIVQELKELQPLFPDDRLHLLLESTAGQGSTVGWKFSHLGFLVHALKGVIPIGICIDTCHCFAAGHDISTEEGLDHMLDQVDREVGLVHLYALHLNDSVHGLGSRKDRHAPLGQGEIGWNAFKRMMNHPKTRKLPKYIETPGGVPLWTKEIEQMRSFECAPSKDSGLDCFGDGS